MPRVIPVGLLLPSPLFSKSVNKTVTNKEGDESIMRFLDKHRPRTVVYIAFGSVVLQKTDKLIEEAALGLEACGQPFLWVGAIVNLSNATSLARSPPPGFVEHTKERGMTLNACAPQLRILQHPSTGAFLSHCGWNSVIESIAGGVPILASPLRSTAGQKMNARSDLLTPTPSSYSSATACIFFHNLKVIFTFLFFHIFTKFWIDRLSEMKQKCEVFLTLIVEICNCN